VTTGARKLATIVALDAAGYSRQSEIDEAVAVREVSALAARVRESAAAHGGRVFNSAGDGFLAEFPSASGAAAFAEEVLAASRIPVRIGMHLGEVTETPDRDLLGRGVNVAARLQTLVAPGEIAISGEVKRALGQPWADRLEGRGELKLDKMEERVELFVLRSSWRARPRWPRLSKRAMALIGIVALLLLAAASGPLWTPNVLHRRDERVAVLEFETIGEGASLRAFAQGLADQTLAVMSTSELRTAPGVEGSDFRGEQLRQAARAANVAFVLDGAVRQERSDLLVSVHVIDARANVTLWSNTYSRSASESAALQEQVAAHAAGILRCALVSRRPRAGEIDAATLSVFLRACDRIGHFDRSPEEMVEIARQVTESAPRFSRGWSMLALASAFASRAAEPERAEEMRALSREAAQQARRLDPANAEAYLALSAILPQVGAWEERQQLIDRALRLDPGSPDALMLQGELLAEVGRMEDALGYFRRATAIDPLSPSYLTILRTALITNDKLGEAEQIQRRLARVWPNSPSGWYNRLVSSMFVGDPNVSLAMLDEGSTAPYAIDDTLRWALRRFVIARRNNDIRALRAAADDISAFARRNRNELPLAAAIESSAGDLDEAFALARLQLAGAPSNASIEQPVGAAGRYVIFMPATRAMRSDIRFMALARDVGLAEHWRETNRWPDFCSDPSLPYDCMNEARRGL
jgi:adenylate cyclase